MADKSAIAWCDATWNCVRGCMRVDEDCKSCYAERLAATRLGRPGGPYEGLAVLTKAGEPHWTGEIRTVEHLLDQPLRWQRPRRIFVTSLSDPFHPGVPVEWLARMWAVMSLAYWHHFQLLTKRPERMRAVILDPAFYDMVLVAARPFRTRWPKLGDVPISDPASRFHRHIWLGTSVGSNAARQRCVDLAQVPAAVRFLSIEPMHGPVDDVPIERIQDRWTKGWVIVGAESGPAARVRQMDDDWVRAVRDRCLDAGIPFFFKQRATGGHKEERPLLDGVRWEQYPMDLERAG